jgi:type I restriction enzyme M protein
MASNNNEIEKRLWDAADELRANSKLKSSEYSVPVLGLIFLRFADIKFTHAEEELQAKSTGRRQISEVDYHARGVIYIPEEARYSKLLELTEGDNIGMAINDAMRAIEAKNPDLKDVLPKTYNRIGNQVLNTLLKNFNLPLDIDGDAFGKIYEYFLGKFAMSEGRKGGEFFTPTSIVRLIVEILEPYHGRIFDPACGSGGMFVQSARFVEEHNNKSNGKISIYGQERVAETVRLCRMNLAVHGLAGDIRQANTYYEDVHNSVGKFDFVMANPPFNVDKVDKERLKDDPRFPLGMPKTDNANYLWIQLFYSALNEKGRAGFVMANSAADARHSEMEIRKKLINDHAVDAVVAIGNNFFYTVTLPCTLWFLDKGKKGTEREDKVLFIDARNIYREIDRAHRDFTSGQIELLSNIVRLYRSEVLTNFKVNPEDLGLLSFQVDQIRRMFENGKYENVAGLCNVISQDEVEAQGWNLNPGSYVEIVKQVIDDDDFSNRFQELSDELATLTFNAHQLEERIMSNAKSIQGIDTNNE